MDSNLNTHAATSPPPLIIPYILPLITREYTHVGIIIQGEYMSIQIAVNNNCGPLKSKKCSQKNVCFKNDFLRVRLVVGVEQKQKPAAS